MNHLFPQIPDNDIQKAKKRLWNRIEVQLPERELSIFQPIIKNLNESIDDNSRLKQVQGKERLLDILPDRKRPVFFFTRKIWAMSTLSMFLIMLFVPVLSLSPYVSAAGVNYLEVVQGETFVNGELVDKSTYLDEGDRIYTKTGSIAHIHFVDDSRVSLGPDSLLQISEVIVNPFNKAETSVHLKHFGGQVWVQVLNLVGDKSSFTVEFPDGEISVNNRASFNIEYTDRSIIEVIHNLVGVRLNSDEVYVGTIGQGAILNLDDGLNFEKYDSNSEKDFWHEFNRTYGSEYAKRLEDSYDQKALDKVLILPGNLFYPIKKFRETVHEVFTFPEEAKQDLLAQHAQTRLIEAQVLISKGDFDAAENVLEDYEDSVEESFSDSDDEQFLALLDEVQKGVLVDQELEGSELLDDYLSKSSVTIVSDEVFESDAWIDSASQKLNRVPELISDGDFEKAADFLLSYQNEMRRLLVELDESSFDIRADIVSNLLSQKLRDLQTLRMIAAMPEFETILDADAQLFEEMSLMILSLRERTLEHVVEFFTGNDHDEGVQEDVYNRLMSSTEIEPELEEQFEEIEEVLAEEKVDVFVDIQVEDETSKDPRFFK